MGEKIGDPIQDIDASSSNASPIRELSPARPSASAETSRNFRKRSLSAGKSDDECFVPGSKIIKVSENQTASSSHAGRARLMKPTSTESRHGAEDYCERLANGPCWAKLLISSEAAHALMSQGLTGLKKLVQKTGAVARISASGAFFPGTTHRVIAMAGTQIALKAMIKEVCHLMISANPSRPASDTAWATINCVVPKTTAANTIANGDVDILVEVAMRSSCHVSFEDKKSILDSQCAERLVKIEGQAKQVVRATRRFFASIQSDPDLIQNIDVSGYPSNVSNNPQSRPSKGGSLPPSVGKLNQTSFPVALGLGMGNQMPKSNNSMQLGIPEKIEQRVLSRQVCMQVPVPPGSAGRMIGKGGSTLRAISGRFGVRIHVSDKDQLFLNSEDRIMSISGVLTDVQRAHCMVEQILQDVEDQMATKENVDPYAVGSAAGSQALQHYPQPVASTAEYYGNGAYEMGGWPTPNQQHYQY